MSPHEALTVVPGAALPFSKRSSLFQEEVTPVRKSGVLFLSCEIGGRRPPLPEVLPEEAFSAGGSPVVYKVLGVHSSP